MGRKGEPKRDATTPRKQCAKQVLITTARMADRLGDKLSEKTTFVIDAAVRAFAELPAEDQVKRCRESRVNAAVKRGADLDAAADPANDADRAAPGTLFPDAGQS